MRSRTRLLTFALTGLSAAAAVLYLSLTIQEDDAQKRAPLAWVDATRPWGDVTGTVLDVSGQPVPGAHVCLQNLQGVGGRGKTDLDGRYRVALSLCSLMNPRWVGRSWQDAVLPDSVTTVYCAAIANGFCGSSRVEVEAHRGLVVEAPTISLWRGGYLAGHTADAHGLGVAARVRVVGRAAPSEAEERLEGVPPGHPIEFVASEVGRGFQIGPIAPGEFEVWATVPGSGACATTVMIAEGETTVIDLAVNLTQHVSGIVVDALGAAVPNVRVICRVQEQPVAGTAVTAGLPDSPAATVGAPTPAPEPAAAAMRLPASPRGKQETDFLTVSPAARASRRGVNVTSTNEGGHFYFYGLDEERTYDVSIVGCRPDSAAGHVGARPSRGDLLLVTPRRYAIQGQVLDGGTGAALRDCVVQILPESSARYLARQLPLGLALNEGGLTRSGIAGDFSTDPVLPGAYRLSFMAQGYEFQDHTVAVEAGKGSTAEALRVELPQAAAVTGVVRDEDESLLSDALVDASCPPARASRPGQIVWIGRLDTRTDKNGQFRIAGLPAHEAIQIRARDRSGNTGTLAIELRAGEDRQVVIRLQRAARVMVKILPRGRGTREGFPVRLVGIDYPEIDVALVSGEDGSGRIKNLPPGRYTLLALDSREDQSRPDVASRVREISLAPGASESIEIEVPAVTMLTANVSIDGVRTPVAKLGFGPLEGTPDHFRPLLFDVTDGKCRGHVPAGTYHVHVRIPGRRFEFADPVVVADGPATTLDLNLISDHMGSPK